ncbi:DUF3010 family protein [Shewanella sp. UCD-KL21]|uniref:DUF3010 family protein n=1 Tax=Shewanella sp. UCD-KL21 TaxID=1917164 RepID=UPI0009713DBA|nr:DUF3010 family protein [Shewanella sp. UCD-KL21]
MKICGVELKGGEAIISLLNYEKESFNVPECRQISFSISKSVETESIREFHFAFHKLMEDYKVDEIVIIEREQKGKFSGSATSFKLEAAIQITELPVAIISPVIIKEELKRNPPQTDLDTLELKRVQLPAFEAAYAQQNRHMYGKI